MAHQQKHKDALAKVKNKKVNYSSLTIMFSKECLANQQLRNTGMKRFLKAGKITCQNDKALVFWLSLPSHAICGIHRGCVSVSAACVPCWDIYIYFIKGGERTSACMHLLSVKWSVIFFPCFLSFYFLSLTVIMKGTALIISRMKGTRKTCSQTFPWKQKKTQSSIVFSNNKSPLLLEDPHCYCQAFPTICSGKHLIGLC